MAEKCECPPEAGAATCEPTTTRASVACPACTQQGSTIDMLTLKAMLVRPLTELRDVEYRFCRTPECPTVYYSADGEQQFLERDIREQVHNKHPDDDSVFVCYCFRHTPESIKRELDLTGRSTVVAAITAGIQAGHATLALVVVGSQVAAPASGGHSHPSAIKRHSFQHCPVSCWPNEVVVRHAYPSELLSQSLPISIDLRVTPRSSVPLGGSP